MNLQQHFDPEHIITLKQFNIGQYTFQWQDSIYTSGLVHSMALFQIQYLILQFLPQNLVPPTKAILDLPLLPSATFDLLHVFGFGLEFCVELVQVNYDGQGARRGNDSSMGAAMAGDVLAGDQQRPTSQRPTSQTPIARRPISQIPF